MRRPMKPFVTEYKPSTRRQLSATRHAQPFAAEPAPAKTGENTRLEATSRTDDSYGAALRAADALFSPQKDKPSPDHGDAADGGARDANGRNSGRILRVLDEPVPELTSGMMGDLEREHAPKRRGRKPGSKNRPKADRAAAPETVSDATTRHAPSTLHAHPRFDASDPHDTSADAAGGDTVARNVALDRVDQHAARHDAEPGGAGSDGATLITQAADSSEAGEPVAVHPSRERRRFSWVRTKLKPGQEWKRRLPKVCW